MAKLYPQSKSMKPKRFFVAVGLLALAFFSSAVLGQEDGRVLVEADTVYTMDGKTFSPGKVLIEDGKIAAVGEQIRISGQAPKHIKLGEGSVLMPGLVDAYSQTALGDGGSNEISKEVTANFKAVHSVDWEKPALRRQLANGTTTMCVCPGTQSVISGVAAMVKTADVEGAILNDDGPLVAAMCSDPASGNRSRSRPDSIYVRQPTNRMGVVWILRNTLNKARGDESPELGNVREALDGKRPMMMFARVSYDLSTIATLADEFDFSPIVVGGQEAHKITELLVERKYPVVLQRIDVGTTSGPERSELCWNTAGVLADAGVTIALSGDDLLTQAQFAVRHGLDRETALEAITSTPAKILGIADRVGSIAVGSDADLIALTGDPLELTTSISWVMINGKVASGTAPNKNTKE
ncbi:MAG: imidazolonepropionase-like amidohydrolase [Mariniblastus sp.]|jgi:imidazolonepropionase-like amidohydrolase